MADTTYGHTFSGNFPKVMFRKAFLQAVKAGFWGKFGKFTTPNMKPVSPKNTPNPVSAPIVIQHELEKQKGDMLEIPIHRNLNDLPRLGDQQAKDHEERQTVNFAHVPIELWRHGALPVDGSMSKLRNEVDLVKFAKPALQNHYVRTSEYLGATYSLLYGYSYNTITSGAFAAETYHGISTLHPHIFTAGSGKVGYGSGYPGNAGYETLVATDVAAVGAADVFDTNFLDALKADDTIQKIKPIVMNDGNPMRLLVIHPYQAYTLSQDTKFRELVASTMAQAYAKDNPLLIGCKYVYEGFAIFVSDTAVQQCSSDGTTATFGPSTITNLDSFESYTSATMFAAFVIGDNALFKGIGGSYEYRKRTDDYGEVEGIIWRAIEGYSRADFWNRDDGTTGQYLINESSAILVTAGAAPPY